MARGSRQGSNNFTGRIERLHFEKVMISRQQGPENTRCRSSLAPDEHRTACRRRETPDNIAAHFRVTDVRLARGSRQGSNNFTGRIERLHFEKVMISRQQGPENTRCRSSLAPDEHRTACRRRETPDNIAACFCASSGCWRRPTHLNI